MHLHWIEVNTCLYKKKETAPSLNKLSNVELINMYWPIHLPLRIISIERMDRHLTKGTYIYNPSESFISFYKFFDEFCSNSM